MSKSWERTQSVKIVLIMLGITLWCLSILVRLAFLQIVRHEEYAQKARIKQQITRSVSAPRGNIYDGSMVVLATSVKVSTVVAEPKNIENKRETARNLAAILKIDPENLFNRMSDPKWKSYLVVKRRIDPADEARIEALDIEGVYFLDESMRVYPNRDRASHTMGFVNMNNDGGAGVELQYDKDLKGEDGLFSFDVDARQQSFRVNVEKPPVQGNSLVLSIDNMIQYITDRELEAAVKNADAKAGTAIVMESDTGRILALSNYPRFNCNNYNEVDPKHWKNMAVTDMFEPGSTFKVVVAAAALDAGLTRPEEMIDCQMGSITLGRHPFRDHKAYGLLTFKEILEHSSNVGAIKLGLRLGQQRLYEALQTFGFGSETGVDLPGEIVGLVRDWKNWSGLSIGAISFGQEVGVTSMQILTAINSIANGGYRVRPSVVDRIIDESRNIIRENQPERIQIISPRTAEAVTEAFEGVVLRGTGRHAALEGYRAAGKTGTAQKSVNGRYQKGSYLSSFIGFAPLPNPRVTILVQIDEPRDGYYGGDICAPYFKNIAQEVLLQLRVPPDTNLTPPKFNPAIANAVSEDFLPDSVPVQPLAESDTDSSGEDQQEIIDIPIDSKWVVLPDFRGRSKRSVLNQCVDLGIHLQSEGSGTAILQSPLPGTKIPVGSTCSVTFTKTDLKENVATLEPHPAVRNVNQQLSSNNSP
jgi:cell division protein FtsI (penicillin-binding protein 3)